MTRLRYTLALAAMVAGAVVIAMLPAVAAPACPPGDPRAECQCVENTWINRLWNNGNICKSSDRVDQSSAPGSTDPTDPSTPTDPGTKPGNKGNHYGNDKPDNNPNDSHNPHDGEQSGSDHHDNNGKGKNK